MDKDERATHFRKFAELLFQEILGPDLYIDVSAEWSTRFDPTDEQYQKYIDLLAKRAYDLVTHVLEKAPIRSLVGADTFDGEPAILSRIKEIPDMTKLPPLDDS